MGTTSHHAGQTPRPYLGVVYLVTALGLTGAVDAAAKWLSQDFTTVFVTWGYFASMTVVYLLYLLATRQPVHLYLKTNHLLLQLARPALLSLALIGFFGGLRYMPLADATTIFFSSPLIITALSGPVLREKVGLHRWLAVTVGMCGVVIVIGPGMSTAQSAALFPLLGAVAWAGFHLVTQALMRSEQANTTLVYTFVGASAWTGILLLFDWQTPISASKENLAMFLVIGILGAAAHFAMLRAHSNAQASYLAPFNYLKLIWAAIFGYAVFQDVPDLRVMSGAVIIIGSGIYVALTERRGYKRVGSDSNAL